MSSDSTRPIKPISPIFSINSKADVIVRSSDNIDFYVSRYFLAYASPVFEGLFSIPSPPSPAAAEDSDETKDGLPILKLAEDSLILERILLLCYPTNLVNLRDVFVGGTENEDVFVGDMEDAAALLLALDKYDMAASGQRLRRLLLEAPFFRADPLRAFAVGCRLRHTELTKLAARYLSDAIVDRAPPDNPDYATFTALQLVKGRNYRIDCALAVRTAVREMETKGDTLWVFASGDKHRDGCMHGSSTWFMWWVVYFLHVKEALEKNPCGPTAMDSSYRVAVMKGITKTGCATCAAMVVRDLPRFSAAFSERIEEEIAKVELDMEW
ncbi:hypothetical protein FIBSPDRAFT_1046297 [Athelia psychrophila]|uniref:Uncharacterized protein n=1 Tax=Athelia psychrophila TaxID=1759441 RepID=A0A166GXI1_9AGAM|nr:hypothetical protein FIBSPDRAFT_1046297 [Fibularhizoctonia sp. CBS 109695]